MGDARGHAAEADELGRIDFFLDQIARAVERGEVPMASYETLAPRYLARREELVAILTSVDSAPVAGSPRREPRPARVREPVRWTTVLLFLGAFLVIVASGIFALAVWSTTGPGFKLGFLGALTIAFYVAGHYARTKLDLRAGSAALTVVGSAMLLFDCWIVIDGWNLVGPIPWAVALLFCSAVYWFTEVRLGDRFYGIAGVAAQVGWWWLMSAGLHVEVPIRLAGIAVIALAWQLVAEKARDDSAFASLAQILLWAAPLTAIAASLGVALDAVVVGTSSLVSAVCAAIVAGAAAAIVLRSTFVPEQSRRWIAGGLQLPVFVLLMQPGPSTWVGVGGLFALTAVYILVALTRTGTPFAVAALAMEVLAFHALHTMLDVSAPVRIGILAALAVTWTLASVLAESLAETPTPRDIVAPESMFEPDMRPTQTVMPKRETAHILQVGGLGLLALMSALAPFVGSGVPLVGVAVPSTDVVLAVSILAAWAASCLIRRGPVPAFATALWSLYAAAALLGWAFPELHAVYYAMGLLVVAASWLAARRPVERIYRIPDEVFGWATRAVSLLVLAVGLAVEFAAIDPDFGGMAVLALAVAVEFALDATFAGPAVSAAFASGVAVIASGLAGYWARELIGDAGLAASGAGAALAGLGAIVHGRWSPRNQWLAVTAAVAGTLATTIIPLGWALVAALALVATAWAAAAVATRGQYLALPMGAALFATAVAGVSVVDPAPWVALVVLGAAGMVLGVPSVLPGTGPNAGHERVGRSLALAGLIGLAFVIAIGMNTHQWGLAATGWPSWTAMGLHGIAVALSITGAYVIAQSVLWKLEAAMYAGYGLILVAICVEFRAWDVETLQLYTSAIALYLAAMGVLYATRATGRRVPIALDVATVFVGVGLPALIAVGSPLGAAGFDDLIWAVLLALVGVGAGIALKVRAYLFGSAAALVIVVGWRSFAYLASMWWLVLGLVGTSMLVIALTWERQRQLLSDTQRRLRDGFEQWR